MKFEKQFLNDKITASCKTYMSPKDYLKRCKQHKLIFWKTIAEANKFSNTTIASTSIFCMFVHLCDLCLLLHLLCYLYLVSFNIVGGYFYVLLNFVAVTSVWILTAFVGHSFSFKDSVRCFNRFVEFLAIFKSMKSWFLFKLSISRPWLFMKSLLI